MAPRKCFTYGSCYLGAARAAGWGGAEELGEGAGEVPLGFLASSDLPLLLQLDSEDAEPNFDEDGQDEYNELHMPV